MNGIWSLEMVFTALFAVLCLAVAFRGCRMPPSYEQNRTRREEMKRKLYSDCAG